MVPFVKNVDQHSYLQLQNRTCRSIEKFQKTWPLTAHHERYKYVDGESVKVYTQEWPLWKHGAGSLISVENVMAKTRPEYYEIAYWFLIVLGEYLNPCFSPLGNWSILHYVLLQSGWIQTDCDFLYRGRPTSQLLKPEIDEKASKKNIYWLWLHPRDAHSGWLNLEDVHRLYNNLGMVEEAVRTFDVSSIPNINVDNPIVLSDYRARLDSGYYNTMAMLKTAIEHHLGLFMSITIYA